MLHRFLAGTTLVVSLAAIAPACAGGSQGVDPCKRALQRLVDECGYTVSGLDALETHCTGQSACVASCLEESPCADIAKGNGEFSDCTAACQ